MIAQWLDKFHLQDYTELWLLVVFLASLFVAFRSYPVIIYFAIKKNLFDVPDERSTHAYKVPTLGGTGIFICLIFAICLTGVWLHSKEIIAMVAGLTLLFFLGLKDDLYVLAPSKKFLGQLVAATFLVIITDLRIIGFSDLFSVQTLPYWVSVAFTVFVIILIINAFNLIDGINGLAGSIALMAALIFAVLFYVSKNLVASTLAMALAGSLIPFLRLNLVKPKIFMGDTGSMIVGFMLAYFTVSFISDVQNNPASDYYASVPVLVQAILFFPLLDTLRIFIIRIFVHKTSPFKADRNHIHHRMLELGYSHIKTTSIILVINLSIIALAFTAKGLNIHIQLILVSGFGIVLFLVPFFKKIKNKIPLEEKLSPSGDK